MIGTSPWRWPAALAPLLALAALGSACTTEDLECEPGDPEPRCCSGGCGSSTDNWVLAVCEGNRWTCEYGTVEYACASDIKACQAQSFCGGNGPTGHEESDPVPELCCELSCEGTKVARRVCESSGLRYVCPAGYLPVSKCADYRSACGGIIQKYRDNGYKLP